MTDRRRRNRLLLVGTFLLFFVPIVGAWLMNIFLPGWLPFGTTNHGILVQPVRPVTAASLRRGEGGAMAADYLTGRWTVVHFPGPACEQDCLAGLGRSRQVQLALGEDTERVQLLLVLPSAGAPFTGDPPAGSTVAVADPRWLEVLVFGETPAPTAGIYLVDPRGYLMMRYPGDVGQRGLLSDLERLLKISKIG